MVLHLNCFTVQQHRLSRLSAEMCCDGGVGTFYTFPREPNCQQARMMFAFNRIPEYFNSDLFEFHSGRYRTGFTQCLTLKRGAVTTLLTSQPQSQPVSS